MRGRVGRSKTRAYAYLVAPPERQMTDAAEKRLKVLSDLDSLGAGFQLASHDLDIRGAGNLLGDEQSGHIKEVGYELYQSMLEDAIVEAKAGARATRPTDFSPQITVDAPILIPEEYVPDLDLRMALPPQGLGLQVLAEVTGCQAVTGGYEIGTSFIDLEDAQRQLLARHVLRQQARVRRADRGDEA